MANVLPPHIEFKPRPVSHAPSPFGFGFGLGSTPSPMASPAWGTATPGHTNPAAFHQLASSITHSAVSFRSNNKRRHDHDDDDDAPRLSMASDDAMERSPTPERTRRAPPKRARVFDIQDASNKSGPSGKQGRDIAGQDDDVDVGVLLASLPSQSLLPLINSLLTTKPELKATILKLLPKPSVPTATQAIAHASKKLRDSFPYHSGNPLPHAPVFDSTRSSSESHFGSSGMRDSYIISRLRPHVAEFVSCCISYLPYFTSIPTTIPTSSAAHSPSQSTTVQSLHKDDTHPSETFQFLSAMTEAIASQQPLTIQQLNLVLIPRLSEEWKAWVYKVDRMLKQGRMFTTDTVRTWERCLDEMAQHKTPEIVAFTRTIRDLWLAKVGYLVNRGPSHAMDV